ncbi:MAG: hypothetical protein KJ621_05515 [Proteobacteria bacterium]|nr:hypothetical protein [Pseudomonadota bacterium]MBU1740885.1 hypothetical protein [Pseudomonadota bacterium]
MEIIPRDYDGIRQWIVDYISAEYPEAWNNFFSSNQGMAILEAVAHVAAMDHLYADHREREAFLGLCIEMANAVEHSRKLGYRPRFASSASVDLTAEIETAQTEDVILEAGYQIRLEENDDGPDLVFELADDLVIPASQTQATVTATEGETFSFDFLATGLPFQKYQLFETPVLDGGTKVYVDDHEWEVVDGQLDMAGKDACLLTIDENDQGTLEFGNGVFGNIPGDGDRITGTYRIGGGRRGNVAAGAIDVQVDGSTPSAESVTIHLTNAAAAGGGEERETIEHIKAWAPRFFATQDFGNTASSYHVLSNLWSDPDLGRVAVASVTLAQNTLEGNLVHVYLWVHDELGGLTVPSAAFKEAFEEWWNGTQDESETDLLKRFGRKQLTDQVEAFDGVTVPVDQTVVIQLKKGYDPVSTPAAVKARAEDLIKDLFSHDKPYKGQPWPMPGLDYKASWTVQLIQDITEVHSVSLTEGDQAIDDNEVAVLGTLDVTVNP